jgi:hypothetical protein
MDDGSDEDGSEKSGSEEKSEEESEEEEEEEEEDSEDGGKFKFKLKPYSSHQSLLKCDQKKLIYEKTVNKFLIKKGSSDWNVKNLI